MNQSQEKKGKKILLRTLLKKDFTRKKTYNRVVNSRDENNIVVADKCFCCVCVYSKDKH